jgi:Zn-finger nucleic acid-binding protein
MQCQACDITLQIIKSQDLELHYCPRCGAMHEVIGGESCEACRDEEARDRLSRWHRWR